jgi:hypothetical protein
VEAPEGWELGAVEGRERKGYCRLDDGEMTRLEIRWQQGLPDGPASLITDRYLKALTGKNKDELRVRRDTHFVEIPGADVETFAWHADVDVTGLAMRCPACGRSTLLRVLNRRSESFRPVAQRVLGSFRDHAEGAVPWSVLGFRFDVPPDYRLESHSLRTGRSEFEFRFRGGAARAVRVGLAEIVLRNQGLADWLKADPAAQMEKSSTPLTETTVRGHAALQAEDRLSNRWQAFFARRIARDSFRTAFATPPSVRLRAWCCPASNALFLARWFGPSARLPEFDRFADSFACH